MLELYKIKIEKEHIQRKTEFTSLKEHFFRRLFLFYEGLLIPIL